MQSVGVTLHSPDVDGLRYVETQTARLEPRILQGFLPHRADEAHLLGDRHELRRSQQSSGWMFPPCQCLYPPRSRILEVDDGLIIDHEPSGLYGLPQLTLQLHTPDGLLVHSWVEHLVDGTFLLSLVHGDVRVPKEVFGSLHVGGGAYRYADAGPDE